MTREEHLAWARDRALEYLDQGDLANAVTSMLSDLAKHEELCAHAGIELGVMQFFGGDLGEPERVRHWIEAFA